MKTSFSDKLPKESRRGRKKAVEKGIVGTSNPVAAPTNVNMEESFVSMIETSLEGKKDEHNSSDKCDSMVSNTDIEEQDAKPPSQNQKTQKNDNEEKDNPTAAPTNVNISESSVTKTEISFVDKTNKPNESGKHNASVLKTDIQELDRKPPARNKKLKINKEKNDNEKKEENNMFNNMENILPEKAYNSPKIKKK